MLKRISCSFMGIALSLTALYSPANAAPGDILSTLSINNTTGDGRIPTSPHGVVYQGGYVWVLDFGTDRIYRVYPKDVFDTDGTTLLHSAGDSDLNIPVTDTDNPPINSDGNSIGSCGSAIPAGQYCGGGGLTFADNFLWNASPVTDDIIKIDPVDGDNLESENALASLAFPAPTDITFDGTNFWILDWQTNTISKVRPEDGQELDSIPGPSSLPSFSTNPSATNARPFGLTWDGEALWVSDRQEDKIYRVSPTDGSLLQMFDAPGSNARGLAWDGESLWHVDGDANTIYRIESGVIPFGLVGCIEKNGVGISGDVLLSQTAVSDQATTTDVNGCFAFANFEAGNPMQISLGESGVDSKPVITLTGGDVTLIVGDTYSEPGVSASDTEDGDISADVVATPDVINTPALIDTSAPNASGIVVTYNVIDSSGNNADPVTRTVFVLDVDSTAPVITLVGDNPLYVEQGSSYVEPGATALDERDGDISGNITISGSVDVNTAGSYTISYNVDDSTGNSATTVTRTVIVRDTTLPVISLVGDNPVTHERGNTYTDAGATANDNIDGDISANIVTTGSVSDNVVGNYLITYNVNDAAGNAAATVIRNVDVVDTTAPVITLIGSNTISHELNTPYTDQGASASDSGDDLSSAIVVTGSVDTSVAGTYTLTYDVSDASGNAATSVSRTVTVADTGAPTITLLGDNPLNAELNTSFTDPGASASDAIDGDLSASINVTGTVDPNTAGSYTLSYNVNDSVGNAAPTVTRNVVVADTTPPLITLLGQATVTQELGVAYVDAGATASDLIDGDLTANIVVGGDTVNTDTAGTYFITYNVSDSAGNAAAPLTRSVEVADRTAPVITILGDNPLNHEIGTIYNDAGATASDNIDGDISANIGVTGSVNASVIGSYTLTYNVQDASGNAAVSASRVVNVVDTGIPVITLIGDNPILHELQTLFTDPGANANDASDGDLSAAIQVSGSVDVNTAGTYPLTYNVSDSQNNAATTVTRNVIVADRTAPVINLNGSNNVQHEQGTNYVDAGASATDGIDGDISANISVSGTVDTAVAGTYTINYNVSDAAGNAATTITRTVTVVDTTAPTITLIGASSLTQELNSVFVDPGANANDNIDGDISANISVVGSVNASAIGVYTLQYQVSDAAGNAANTVTRTVEVVDSGSPAIVITGDNPLNLNINTPYVEQGASATDAADGDLSANIIIGGDTVDSTTAGTYLVTYDVTDSGGNAADQQVRTVNVADFEAPVITLQGTASVNVELGTSYTDAGATASDNVDGVLTASIVTTGSVDPLTAGTYTIRYNVSDIAGNAATEVTRSVIVSDTIAPVITLIGAATINHEQGTPYTDQGASASDSYEGDLSANINVTGFVGSSAAGTYTLNYNVSDSAGNNATTVTRTVIVSDTIAPTLALVGDNPYNQEQGFSFTDPGVNAVDNLDGNISANVIVTGSVDSSTAGSYQLTYNISDASGNAAPAVTRSVVVADTLAPSITLLGSANFNHEQGTPYNDQGATALDTVDGDLTSSIAVTGSVDANTAGVYTLSYNVSDAIGNAATTITRHVTVGDTTLPVLTLLGNAIVNHPQGSPYSDAGASALDNIDGNISANITTSGSVNVNVAGTYVISYNVNDAAGNAANTITRTVNIGDSIPPVISLLGDANVVIEQGSGAYVDAGATASDNIDGNLTSSIVVSGNTVNTNAAGVYIVRYDVSDSAGNNAPQVVRTVTVQDTIAPTLTLIGASTINHPQNTTFIDPGASATDSADGDISASIITTGSVDISTIGTYTLTYNVSDNGGNAATAVTRTVNVTDGIAPVITLLGATTIDQINGELFVDPGATASDNLDGDITANITTSGTLDINTDGSYTLNYDVSDAAGNAATTVSRTVNVVTPTSILVEAESGSIVGGPSVETGGVFDSGFTGSGYVDLGPAQPGDYLEFSSVLAFGTTYNLTIRHASNLFNSNSVEVILNGQSVGTIDLPSTGLGTTTYTNSASISITPQSGTNTIRLNVQEDSGTKKIDSFTLTPQ